MKKIFRYPALVLIVIGVITVFFALQLPRVEFDNNNYRFLPEKNQSRLDSDYIEQEFGSSVSILIGLERQYGTVYEKDFLDRIREFSKTIEKVEFVKNVNSIMSTQYITADGDSIVAADLVPEDFSGTAGEIAELERKIASWDMYQGALVSDDLSATQILIQLDVLTEDAGTPAVVASLIKIRDTARQMFDGMSTVYVTGQPVMSAAINESINADVVFLIPLVLVVLLAVLFFSFRRFSAVVLPLLTVIIAVVWSVGAMPLFDIRLSMISMLLPVILVAVGSAYGIHVVTHYLEDTRNRTFTAEEHRELVLSLLRKIIKPVFLAALTTFAGFLSFCFTPITPIREFGYFSSFGVFASFFIAVTLIPSFYLLRGPGKTSLKDESEQNPEQESSFNDKVSHAFLLIAQHKYIILVVTALLIVISAIGFSRLIVDNVVVEYFKGDTDISKSDKFIREHFGGSKAVSLVVEADSSEVLLNPKVLKAVDDMGAYFKQHEPMVGKTVGFTDMIKRLNQVFNTDESPDGLSPAAPGTASSAPSAFGFDDEAPAFGFGDWGASDESPAAEDDFLQPEQAGKDDDLRTQRPTVQELVGLLDSAAIQSPKMSGSDLVRELKRLTNYEGASYYEIPSEPVRYGKTSDEELTRLIANYLVLLSGDESGYANDPLEPTAIKTTIQLRSTGQTDTDAVIDRISKYAEANIPKTVHYIIGGEAMLEGAITSLVVQSQIITIVFSILMVFVIMAGSYRSLAAGLIGSVSVALAVWCNFAIMGFIGVKLNIGTALIASLTVGMGIDYTIHFMEFFKNEYEADHREGLEFLRRTFSHSGQAIIVNALSVGAGFGVLAFSRFQVICDMGILVALSMIITAAISLTVIPALLLVTRPKFIYGKGTALK